MHITPHGSSVRIADVVPAYKKPKGSIQERLFEERIATSAVLPEHPRPRRKAGASGKAMHTAEGRQRIKRAGANLRLVGSSITKVIIR